MYQMIDLTTSSSYSLQQAHMVTASGSEVIMNSFAPPDAQTVITHKLCVGCCHNDSHYWCHRKLIPAMNLVTGAKKYSGERLACDAEREPIAGDEPTNPVQRFFHSLFWPRPDRCGTDGQYWEPIDPLVRAVWRVKNGLPAVAEGSDDAR